MGDLNSAVSSRKRLNQDRLIAFTQAMRNNSVAESLSTGVTPSLLPPPENLDLERNLSQGMTPTPSTVNFFTPTNIAKNQAPIKVPGQDLKALVNAVGNSNSPIVQKYFIPNTLVENRFTSTVQPMDQGKPYGEPYVNPSNYGLSMYAYEELKRQGNPMDYNKVDDPNYMASRAAEFFDFKTGKDAERIYGKDATDAQRISLWNGRGKKMNPYTLRVEADAENHSRKVMGFEQAMSATQNEPFAQAIEQIKIKRRLGMQ
jgi:hypothetical protein